jgi:hypothetical protein
MPNRKNVNRLPPSARQLRSSQLPPSVCKHRLLRHSAKRKKPLTSSLFPEDVAVIAGATADVVVEDVKFQDVMYFDEKLK